MGAVCVFYSIDFFVYLCFNKKLLQIEKASGVEYSEKYLIGFLEEKNRSYVEYINDLFTEYERSQKTDAPIGVEEEKGFFKRFFGIH